MSEKYKNTCKYLNYTLQLLILVSVVTGKNFQWLLRLDFKSDNKTKSKAVKLIIKKNIAWW